MSLRNSILAGIFVIVSGPAWCNVFIHWSSSVVLPAAELGVNDLVLSWSSSFSAQAKAARKQGYRVYIEVSLDEADSAADSGDSGLAGIILIARASEDTKLEKLLPKLQSAHPKLRFMVLDVGKRPEMRGSLVIKRDSVLEVSSPTAQPWIDTNLALVKIEQRSRQEQLPLYTFSWAGQSDSVDQPPTVTVQDYTLAVAEAGAFHADLVLKIDGILQKRLIEHDPQAWALWKEVRLYANFYSNGATEALQAAANVAVVVEELDADDEAMNLLARHNIPYKVLLPADLKSADLERFDLVVIFAKPDAPAKERLREFAANGKTVVLVAAQGPYPWQNGHPVRVNEHVVSYPVGKGKVLELSETVTDPEMFAQDIRRLLGKESVVLSLWNGLTTIAVPYSEWGGTLKVLEFINYAEDPLRLQVQVKGSFASVRYETPEHQCCESLVPVKHAGFTEFVIPELRIAGRVYLEPNSLTEAQPGPK